MNCGIFCAQKRRLRFDRRHLYKWCQRADLNCRPKAYESSALPLSYSGLKLSVFCMSSCPATKVITVNARTIKMHSINMQKTRVGKKPNSRASVKRSVFRKFWVIFHQALIRGAFTLLESVDRIARSDRLVAHSRHELQPGLKLDFFEQNRPVDKSGAPFDHPR